MAKIRVSSFARSYGVLSKDVIKIANMTGGGPNKQVLKSASSGINVDENTRIYWDCVARAASRRRDNRTQH